MQQGDVHQGYRLERVIGRGSRAVVWEATQLVSGKRYALKVLETLATGADARFLQEFRVQAALKHPNIVHVHAFLEIEHRLVFVLDRVPGPNLAEWMEQNRPDRTLALKIFGGILRGLRAAHDAGLVHRDLKPSNVIVQLDDPPVPRITDFGEAKTTEGVSLTTDGMVLGTIRYMPPEQLSDASDVDARADLFAAGCILYELLTGDKAYDATNKIAVMNAVRTGEHGPIPEDLPEKTKRVLQRMLSPHRDERPDSADDVLQALGLPLQEDVALADAPIVRSGITRALVIGAVTIGLMAAALVLYLLLR